ISQRLSATGGCFRLSTLPRHATPSAMTGYGCLENVPELKGRIRRAQQLQSLQGLTWIWSNRADVSPETTCSRKCAEAAEIQLLPCDSPACCSVRRCAARVTLLARYTDRQGRPLRQRELCERHAEWLRENRENVLDLRGSAPC